MSALYARNNEHLRKISRRKFLESVTYVRLQELISLDFVQNTVLLSHFLILG